jgi:hypothetical protein
MTVPRDPHAIIEIERSGMADGQSLVTYDTWETKRLIKQVTVELVTNQSSEARVTFFDPNFRVIDAFSDVTAKTVVKIYLGFGQSLGEPVFKGVLAQLERGEAETTMIIFDMAFVMKLEKRAGYKNKKDDVAIMKGLVERNKTPAGMPLKFDGPGKLDLEPHNAMMQDQLSDWDWLMERAQDAGLLVYVRQDTVFARKPAKTGTVAMTLKNRKDFTLLSGWDLTYRTPENLDGRPKVVTHRRRGRNGKFLKGRSDEATRGREDTVIKRDMQRPTGKKLSKRAQAQKDLDKEYAFEGRIENIMPTDGTRLDVRNTIKLEGVGKLLGGKYVCRSVRYRFAPGGMSMDLEIYRDIDEKK